MSACKDDDLYGGPRIGAGKLQDRLRDPALLRHWWDQYGLEAADRIDALDAECDALRKDALRYRWWKEHFCAELWYGDSFRLWIHLPTQERGQIDAAIDAEIAK